MPLDFSQYARAFCSCKPDIVGKDVVAGAWWVGRKGSSVVGGIGGMGGKGSCMGNGIASATSVPGGDIAKVGSTVPVGPASIGCVRVSLETSGECGLGGGLEWHVAFVSGDAGCCCCPCPVVLSLSSGPRTVRVEGGFWGWILHL